jgi:hypothetical protein
MNRRQIGDVKAHLFNVIQVLGSVVQGSVSTVFAQRARKEGIPRRKLRQRALDENL